MFDLSYGTHYLLSVYHVFNGLPCNGIHIVTLYFNHGTAFERMSFSTLDMNLIVLKVYPDGRDVNHFKRTLRDIIKHFSSRFAFSSNRSTTAVDHVER